MNAPIEWMSDRRILRSILFCSAMNAKDLVEGFVSVENRTSALFAPIATSRFPLVLAKTYDRFLCATEEGYHQISCPDDKALLTDISVRKVYRRTQMCAPDDHSDYLVHCQSFIDASTCEGNQTCSIEFSSRDYLQCGEKTYAPTYFYIQYTCIQSKFGHGRSLSRLSLSAVAHTMCTDTAPIRNTLNGFIVSPAYPHPMADNLKCSINIGRCERMLLERVSVMTCAACRGRPVDVHRSVTYSSATARRGEMPIGVSGNSRLRCVAEREEHEHHLEIVSDVVRYRSIVESSGYARALSDRLEFSLHIVAHEHVEETAIFQDSLQK